MGWANSKGLNPNGLSERVWFAASTAVCFGDLVDDQLVAMHAARRGYNWLNISWTRNEEQERIRHSDVYMRSMYLSQAGKTRVNWKLGKSGGSLLFRWECSSVSNITVDA
jgi:hypothetical protein